MSTITPDQHAALLAAYDTLGGRSAGVTVAALRSEAGVSQNVASVWLRERRADEQAEAERAARAGDPDLPEELSAAALAAQSELWHRAMAAARQEVLLAHADELEKASGAQAAAERSAADAKGRAAGAEHELKFVKAELTTAQQALADLRQRVRIQEQAIADTKVAADEAVRAAEEKARRAGNLEREAHATAAELRGRVAGLEQALSALKTETDNRE